MRNKLKKNDGYILLIGLLFAVLVMGFLYLNSSTRMHTQPEMESYTQDAATETGIDVSSYQKTLDSTENQLKRYEKMQENLQGQLMEELENQ